MKGKTLLLCSTLFILIMTLLLPFAVSCNQRSDEGADSQGEDLGDPMVFAENKQSDYTIVYNSSDTVGRAIVTELGELLYNRFGVSFTTRSDVSDYEKEIVVGQANREYVATVREELSDEDDFFVGVKNGNLYVYAQSSAGMRKMFRALENVIWAEEDTVLSMRENYRYFCHDHSEEVNQLCHSASISKNASDYVIIVNEDKSNGENNDIKRIAKYVKDALNGAGFGNPSIYEDYEDYGAEGKTEFVIGVSGVDREDAAVAASVMTTSDDFIMTVGEKGPVLLATDVNSLIVAAKYFVSEVIPNSKDCLELRESEEYVYSMNGRNFTVSQDELYDFCVNVMKRYPTLYDFYLRSGKAVSSDGVRDQNLIDALVKRMGTAAAFYVGSSNVIYDGMIRKLDTTNYDRVCMLRDGKLWIPAEFADSYFNVSYPLEVMVDLNDITEKAGASLYYDESSGLVIVTPKEVASFGDAGALINGYTNKAYIDRILKFFTDPAFPEPMNNTSEQTRVVIDTKYNFPEKSLGYDQYNYVVTYSPSIITTYDRETGYSVLYASYELCNINDGAELSTVTMIQKSLDGGKTWTEFCKIPNVRWAELFILNGELYVLGSEKTIMLSKISSEGEIVRQGRLFDYPSGITQILIDGGYIYFPADFGVASANINDDLFEQSSWTVTEDPNKQINMQWFTSITGKTLDNLGTMDAMEANAIKGPDGKIYIMYRIETEPNADYAALFRLSDDRTALELLPYDQSLVSLPTTVSRFTIKYDKISGYYIMLSNWFTEPRNGCRARNVMGMSVSKDLLTWIKIDVLLTERELMNEEASVWAHAFQYTDWDFDGNDIVMDVREATGYCNTFHDGKYLTFYRLQNFRELIAKVME